MSKGHGKHGHRFFKHAVPAPPLTAATTTGASVSTSDSKAASASKD